MHPVAEEHEFEPVPGLPERLPEGERIVWQGRPNGQLFARHVMKTRWLAGYFGVLVLWAIAAAIYDGRSLGSIVFSVAVLGLLGAVLLGLCELYAWGVQKTTLYTITNNRIVMRIGVALSMTLNIPFKQIATVNRTDFADGSGTLTIQLLEGQRFSWLVLWPHVRPWRLARTEPALRCMPEVDEATTALLDQLSDYGAQTIPVRGETRPATSKGSSAAPHPDLVAG